jgi:hypothetical protein
VSSLETSVTLEDVFSVVEGKRVPLAPELAGYLSLEIADGADPGGGAIDPRSVFISEEGTVAQIRKKDASGGDAEASVRATLQKLLDASGSSTPALTAAAKRKPVAGLPALVEELEAALIPVNRAAGRRALARLAREVKRVTMGVGRNASVPPVRGPSRSEEDARPASAAAEVIARARPRSSVDQDDAPTTKHTGSSGSAGAGGSDLPRPLPPPRGRGVGQPGPPIAPARPGAPAVRPIAAKAAPPPVTAPPRREPGAAGPAGTTQAAAAAAAAAAQAEKDKLFGGSEVDDLLAAFEVSGAGDKQMSRDLKAIAGLDPTPPPPDARTIADLAKDVGKDLPRAIARPETSGDSVEALLALADASPPGAPRGEAAHPKAPQGVPGAVAAPSPRALDVSEPPHGAAPLAPPLAAPLGAPGAPPPLGPPAAPPPLGAPAPPSPYGVPAGPPPVAPQPAPGLQAAPRGAPPPVSPPIPFADIPPPAPPREPGPRRADTPPKGQKAASGRHKKSSDVPPPAAPMATTARRAKTASARRPKQSRAGLLMLVLAVAVLGVGAAAIYELNPAFFTGRKPHPTATQAPAPPPPPVPVCKVALVVQGAPANAEILLRVGQSPLDVERMPVGTRLEFVATAEGYAPRRAIIKAESVWDKGPDGKPRIDLPVQLDPSKAKPGTIDPWPAAEPGSQVGGSGAPGTVHVVANVRGAEIWLLAGLGPEARIEQLRCDGDIDVLLAGSQSLRKRLHVSEKEIAAAPADPKGNKVVTTSAK